MLSRINRAIQNYGRQRRTIRELSGLSDRELRDLGISRYDIPRIAKQSGTV